MKVLFLNPPLLEGGIYMKELGRCGRKSISGEIWPQTGLAYLASVVRQKGHQPIIIDGMAQPCDAVSLARQVAAFCPEVIIVGVSTPTFHNDAKISALLKEQVSARIGFIGTHVAALPEYSLLHSCADFVIVSEGEHIVLDILDVLAHKDRGWDTIPGIWWKDPKGVIHENPGRGFIENLDSLPYPARDLLPNHRYTMPFFSDGPFVTIIPSRGCPFSCIFCRAGKVWGNTTRRRSVNNVVGEIKYVLNNLDIHNIVFMTDLFTLYKAWVMELCDEIIKEKLSIKWICNSRVDHVEKEMLLRMKQAGCMLISYGVESADQAILDRAKKKITVEASKNAIRLTREAGILSFAYFILGLPGETHQTAQKTIQFACALNPDYVNFHIATPFPGTEFYDIARQHGWLVEEDWTKYEEEGSAVVRTSALSCQDLISLQKTAMKKFYIRPAQIWRECMRVKTPRDFATKIKAGFKMIRIGK